MKRLVVLFLLISSTFILAQEANKVNLSNPNATIYTHLFFLQKDSYNLEKAAKTIIPNSTDDAAKAAVKLKQILDGKGLLVDFKVIPKNTNYKDSLNYTVAVNKYVLFPERMPLISVEKLGDKWYYSLETIQNLDEN